MSLFKSKKEFFKAIANADLPALVLYLDGSMTDRKKWLDSFYDGETVLTQAIKYGNIRILEALLMRGARTGLRSGSRPFALGLAIEKRDLNAFNLLLKAGANPSHGSSYDTPINYAVNHGLVNFIQPLIDAKANLRDNDVIGYALAAGHFEIVDLLAKAGVDTKNPMNHRSRYLLHYAAESNIPETIDHALKYNPNTDVTDSNSDTPLHLAARNRNYAICVKLVEAGASLEIKNANGRTPFEEGKYQSENAKSTLYLKNAIKDKKEQLKKNALEALSFDRNDWELLGTEKIAHICSYKVLDKQITEIFNFESRERMTIIDHLKNSAMSSPVIEKFDALDNDMLRKVFDIYSAKGGTLSAEKALAGKSFSRLKPSN